jgi:hypothetical protein
MIKRQRKYFLIIALLLSIIVHVIALAPIVLNMSWQEIISTIREKISQLFHPEKSDEVLARKKATFVPKVSLNLDADTASNQHLPSNTITIRLIHDQPVNSQKQTLESASKKSNIEKVKSKSNKINQSRQPHEDLYTELMSTPTSIPKTSDDDDQSEGTDDPTLPYDLDQNTLIDNTTVHITPQPTTKFEGTPAASLVATGKDNTQKIIKSEFAPSFPAELKARYRTTVLGLSLNIYREWRMEGRHYSIVDSANLFGLKGSMTSEGSITSRGLEPENFEILLNNNINRFAKFNRNNMTMTYGRPSNPKQMSFNPSIQDISSIGFQMAIAYSDKAQDIQITYGTGIFPIHLELLDEEQLKLPVGIVRTLHIQGQSLSGEPATADIWLAPDYRNMPVKIKVSSEGRTLIQSLSSLSIEGTVIFGKKYAPQDANDPDSSNSKSAKDLSEKNNQESEF